MFETVYSNEMINTAKDILRDNVIHDLLIHEPFQIDNSFTESLTNELIQHYSQLRWSLHDECVDDIFKKKVYTNEYSDPINKNSTSTQVHKKLYMKHLTYDCSNKLHTSYQQRINGRLTFKRIKQDVEMNKNIEDRQYPSICFMVSKCGLHPCRLHFDIDKSPIPLDIELVKQSIVNTFKRFSINITHIGVCESHRQKDGKMKYNYHIVVPEVAVLPFEMILFDDYVFNSSAYYDLFGFKYDDCVLKEAHVFRLPYSSDVSKPYQYTITNGTFDDWDLANISTSNIIHITDLIPKDHIKQHETTIKINDMKTNTFNPLSYEEYACYKSLPTFSFEDKYNYKLTMKQLTNLIEGFVSNELSKPININKDDTNRFIVHNYYTGINPVSNKRIYNRYMFARDLFAIIYEVNIIEHFHLFKIGNKTNKQKFIQQCFEDFEILNAKFTPLLTPNAIQSSSLLNIIKSLRDILLPTTTNFLRLIKSYDENYFNNFVLNEIEQMNTVCDSKEFLHSSFTFNDYIDIKGECKTIQEHINALVKCVAWYGSGRGLVVKDLDSKGRIKYNFYETPDTFAKDYNSTIIVHSNISKLEDQHKTRMDIKDLIVNHIDGTNYFLRFKKKQIFVDNDTYNIKNGELQSNTQTLIDEQNRLIITDFTTPMQTKIDLQLVQDWIHFMFTRIDKAYHNAFIDLLYSIRYRLTTSKHSPSKIYIAYGKDGHEGKSFMFGCLGKVFGDRFQVCAKSNIVNDQFNNWVFEKGMILIEEAQNNERCKVNTNNLAQLIKLLTTPEGSSRAMYKETESATHYAIYGLNTNDETLDGLVYEDPALISRLAIMKFNSFKGDWSEYEDKYPNNQTFAYSLYAYLIANNGFIEHEGKSYEYNSNRYHGKEKYDYVNEVVNRGRDIVMSVLNKFCYNEDVYNDITSTDVDDESIKHIFINQDEHIEYIDYNFFKLKVDEQVMKNKSKVLTKKDVDVIMGNEGWIYDDKKRIDFNKHSKVYYKDILETNILYDFHLEYEQKQEENHMQLKETNKNEIVDKLLKEFTNSNKNCEYILVEYVNKLLKEMDKEKVVIREDVENKLSTLGYGRTPVQINHNKKSKLAYRKDKK